MKITVKDGACVGAGQCALVAEDVFDQDDEGLVLVLDSEPDASHAAAVRRAVSLCPARAISLQE